jgi:hypothetical protein
LRTILSVACVSCSGSASNSGRLVSKSQTISTRGKLRLHEAAHARDDLVDVRPLERRQAVGRQQPVDQRLQAIRFADDDLRVLDQLRAIELALQELSGAADAAERIPDLVREIPDQFAVRLLLLVQPLFARDLELLIDVAEFEQECSFARVDGRHRAREMELRLAGDGELELLLRVRRADVDRLVDGGGKPGHIAEHLVRPMPDEMLFRELEQVFRRRVGIGHAARGIEDEHGSRQQFEPGECMRSVVGGRAMRKKFRDRDHVGRRSGGGDAAGAAGKPQQDSRPRELRAPRLTVT